MNAWIRGALTGFEAGVLGSLALLMFMTIIYLVKRQAWWSYPNLLATLFYGSRGLMAGPGWATAAGAGFQVLIGGASGFMFGLVSVPVRRESRLTYLGLVWGVVWYYASVWFYRSHAGLIPLYAPEFALLAAHAMFGLILGRGVSAGRHGWKSAAL